MICGKKVRTQNTREAGRIKIKRRALFHKKLSVPKTKDPKTANRHKSQKYKVET